MFTRCSFPLVAGAVASLVSATVASLVAKVDAAFPRDAADEFKYKRAMSLASLALESLLTVRRSDPALCGDL